MTTYSYYEAISIALDISTEIISQNSASLPLHIVNAPLQGRSGSQLFEDEILKPLLRQHEVEIVTQANKRIIDEGVIDTKLVSIQAVESITEADGRTLEDVSYTFITGGIEHTEVVNVKLTQGGTADNVGGWACLSYALFGTDTIRTKTAAITHIQNYLQSNENFPNGLHDYFLWTFTKGDSIASVLASGKAYSLLSASHQALVVNMSQPFPLQFNHKRATELSALPKELDITTQKKNLVKRLFEAQAEYHKNALQHAQAICNLL